MKSRVWLAFLAAGLTAGAAVADDVHLANGEVFEGVIAERVDEQVVIRLEYGELRLPVSAVERIESADSPLAGYLERRRALLAREASALEWLELARWARSWGLDHGYRESLLEAASIDPTVDRLAPGMRDLDYVFDEELARWIPYAEHLRRTRPAPPRQADSRSAHDDHREVEEALSRTLELLAMAELTRESREANESRQATASVGRSASYGFPVAYFPGGFYFGPVVQPTDEAPGQGDASPTPTPVTPNDLFRRPPGSLLPVGGANSGVRVRQPGSLLPVKSSRR